MSERVILVKLDVYRGCLNARGWQRETGSLAGNPPGFYRGLEDEGSIRVGDVPSRSGRPRGRAWETGGPGRITSNSRTGVSRVALGDTFFCTGSSFLLYVCREAPGHQHRLTPMTSRRSRGSAWRTPGTRRGPLARRIRTRSRFTAQSLPEICENLFRLPFSALYRYR
jgi:hypothetical protein